MGVDAHAEPGPDALRLPLHQLAEGRTVVGPLPSGRKAIVVKHGGQVAVFGELCPHMGADMSEAHFCARSGTLRCRWHGYLFSAADGRLLENPNERFLAVIRKPSPHFKPEKTPRYRLPTVPHRVEGGALVIGRVAAAPTCAPADTP